MFPIIFYTNITIVGKKGKNNSLFFYYPPNGRCAWRRRPGCPCVVDAQLDCVDGPPEHGQDEPARLDCSVDGHHHHGGDHGEEGQHHHDGGVALSDALVKLVLSWKRI